MRDSVRRAFPDFTDKFENRLGYMYTDKLGLVTTGRGNLIDTGPRRIVWNDPLGNADPAMALALPWVHGDDSFASAAEIRNAWWTVKRAWPAMQSTACVNLTGIRILAGAIDELTFKTLDRMWAHLLGRFPDLEQWPADAQLALISMSWAMGSAFSFPAFEAFARANDWAGCSRECFMKGPGIAGRNAANAALFNKAASASDFDLLSA